MADIRPMDFGEILDGSLTIYRRHFGLFLRLAAITLSVPFVLLVYLATQFPLFLTRQPSVQIIVLGALAAILYYLASLVLTAGTIRVISDAYLGRQPQLGQALSLGLAKLGSLIGVAFGKGVVLMGIGVGTAVVLGLGIGLARASAGTGASLLAATVVAGVWFAVFVLCGYGVTTPVVVLEDLASAFDAFGRSWTLTRGFKLKVAGLSLVSLFLANFLPQLVLRGLGTIFLATLPAVGLAITVVGYAVPLILTPVIAAVITLMYYDLRVRREAFDLQVLSQELGIV